MTDMRTQRRVHELDGQKTALVESDGRDIVESDGRDIVEIDTRDNTEYGLLR